MELIKKHKMFDGEVRYYNHSSSATKTDMKFSGFIPHGKVDHCLIWLSGLTCNEENFITKAGAQKFLAGSSTMIICPDTSPRGLDLPGEHQSYDFGSGAGFYIDAKTAGYKDHYQMESYIMKDLMSLLTKEFSIEKYSIFGHSMGGHGALTLALKHPDKFVSVSAFSPIVHPSVGPWGKKAFTGYLGDDIALWKEHDATELVMQGKTHPFKILIDQGLADEFYEKELLTGHFIEAAKQNHQEHQVRFHEGYDHSYFFIASFIEDHIKHHLKAL